MAVASFLCTVPLGATASWVCERLEGEGGVSALQVSKRYFLQYDQESDLEGRLSLAGRVCWPAIGTGTRPSVGRACPASPQSGASASLLSYQTEEVPAGAQGRAMAFLVALEPSWPPRSFSAPL